jgi:aspartate/methionine/tyrosine aminotransferase
MPATPIAPDIVRRHVARSGLQPVGLASIRELNHLVSAIAAEARTEFIRMEMGVPGLPPPQAAIEAETAALRRQVGADYPPFDGIPELKREIARFLRLFMDVTVDPAGCLPTVGSMQGTFLALLTAGRRRQGRDRILFLDPGFPVNKRQVKLIGLPHAGFDLYDYRGDRLGPQLESFLQAGDVAAVLYSTPNNPAWICLSEQELETIGRLCNRYDVIALEDQAYFGMDFRQDYGRPGRPPFIPTVAKYTDKAILLISASKAFSLAGQRIGMMAVADALFQSTGDGLEPYFGSNRFGYALVYGGMYGLSAGVSHSAQWGLTGMLRAVNSGAYDFVAAVREYGRRAAVMKGLFQANGFHLVYDRDQEAPLADGFYFTVAYPGFSGAELVEELLYYGISAISLATTGSRRLEGIRACVSRTPPDKFDLLAGRLARFHEDHRSGWRIGK